MPDPIKGESEKDYIARFMASDEAQRDFPDPKQRAAVAYSKSRERNNQEPTMKKDLCGAGMSDTLSTMAEICPECCGEMKQKANGSAPSILECAACGFQSRPEATNAAGDSCAGCGHPSSQNAYESEAPGACLEVGCACGKYVHGNAASICPSCGHGKEGHAEFGCDAAECNCTNSFEKKNAIIQGKCKGCGKEGEVSSDNGYCEDCNTFTMKVEPLIKGFEKKNGMEDQLAQAFAERAANAAMAMAAKGAAEYLRQHGLKADPDKLRASLREKLKAVLFDAIKDAKEAFDANMAPAGLQTFQASMVLAGIEAAKEAGQKEHSNENRQPQPGDKFIDCPICDRKGEAEPHQVKPADGKMACEKCGHVYPEAKNADLPTPEEAMKMSVSESELARLWRLDVDEVIDASGKPSGLVEVGVSPASYDKQPANVKKWWKDANEVADNANADDPVKRFAERLTAIIGAARALQAKKRTAAQAEPILREEFPGATTDDIKGAIRQVYGENANAGLKSVMEAFNSHVAACSCCNAEYQAADPSPERLCEEGQKLLVADTENENGGSDICKTCGKERSIHSEDGKLRGEGVCSEFMYSDSSPFVALGLGNAKSDRAMCDCDHRAGDHEGGTGKCDICACTVFEEAMGGPDKLNAKPISYDDAVHACSGTGVDPYIVYGFFERGGTQQAFLDACEDQNCHGNRPDIRERREKAAALIKSKFGITVNPHWDNANAGATIDHSAYPASLRSKSEDQLRFIIKDANEAVRANPDAEKSKSGYYEDEICYAEMELARRRKEPKP